MFCGRYTPSVARADQVPTNSQFHPRSTGDEVLTGIDLDDCISVVTGGYSGIGLETVRALSRRGATVIVPVRSPEKAKESLAGIPGVRTVSLDLADIRSVRSCGENLVAELPRIDLLIANAGIMACPESRVGPGWESQFGVNHMGHFALTKAVTPLLKKSGHACVIALSSTGHKLSGICWDDIQFESTTYDKWRAYG
ncbi:MAG: SDR family NAD(P)-dependent oxidoreductase, partial [Planctomycetales bacterium]|nr:SDR family NAD(P)-dependent oxidoreductase [Planctomycetales bacterium]